MSNQSHASLRNIFTFRWFLWKSQNDRLFQIKKGRSLMQAKQFAAWREQNDLSNSVGTEVGLGICITTTHLQQYRILQLQVAKSTKRLNSH